MKDHAVRVVVIIIGVALITLSVIVQNRIDRIEKIVGFETPASSSWTNGHTYMTVVKHSANCPCVKK